MPVVWGKGEGSLKGINADHIGDPHRRAALSKGRPMTLHIVKIVNVVRTEAAKTARGSGA
jgi:hypothetical protein